MDGGRSWRLAMAMVGLELIAGMQVYVSATVTPLLAADLGGRGLYGLSAAAAQMAMFLSLPLSPALMRRWSSGRLLTVFTAGSVVAACCSSLAPTMWAYIAARSVAGLCSGALAGVGMGVLAKELTGRARRFTLAANNAMWVASSLAGPAYASWLSAAFSWRVALVAYLPFLVAARLVIIREVRDQPVASNAEAGNIPVVWAVVLAGGMLLLGLRPPTSTAGACLVGVGLVLVAVASWRLIPQPVRDLRNRGGGMVVRAIGWAAGLLFGVDSIVTILAHDAMGWSVRRIGVLLTSGGLAWALVGFVSAARPAPLTRFRWQGGLSLLVMGVGSAGMAWSMTHAGWVFTLGWVVMNLGMGLVYLDALNLAFDDSLPGALPPAEAGATVAFIEPLSSGVTGTLAAGLVSATPTWGATAFYALSVLALPAAADAFTRGRRR